jgi:hypothetical protein
MTASDTPRKRPGRKPKPPVARSLRRVRNKDLPTCCEPPLSWHPTTEDGRIELAIDTSLVDAQKTITTMLTDTIRNGCCCDHMALYMLQQLVGRALTLTRRQRQTGPTDVP